jgi:ApbE superfamily uncharacterized protein (UPF0280 family)
MTYAARKAGTGPMAAVAGAVAEYVGYGLLPESPEIIVENGGDLFVKVDDPVTIGIFAGNSPFSNRLGIRVTPGPLALGVCTSSASVGPSVSLGGADAAVIIARDVCLADAAASGLGNRVKRIRDLKSALSWAMSIKGVDGALAIIEDRVAAQGAIELVPLAQGQTLSV